VTQFAKFGYRRRSVRVFAAACRHAQPVIIRDPTLDEYD